MGPSIHPKRPAKASWNCNAELKPSSSYIERHLRDCSQGHAGKRLQENGFSFAAHNRPNLGQRSSKTNYPKRKLPVVHKKVAATSKDPVGPIEQGKLPQAVFMEHLGKVFRRPAYS
jgi:hypothetical protein